MRAEKSTVVAVFAAMVDILYQVGLEDDICGLYSSYGISERWNRFNCH